MSLESYLKLNKIALAKGNLDKDKKLELIKKYIEHYSIKELDDKTICILNDILLIIEGRDDLLTI